VMSTMFATQGSVGSGLGSTQSDGGGMAVNVQAFLKPARKRLGTVDAERIIKVVDLAIEKIELLCITSSPEFQLLEQEAGADEEFSFPPVVASALDNHRQCEAAYEQGLTAGEGGHSPEDDGGASYFALQKSTRTLLGAIQRAALPELMQAAAEVEDGQGGLGLALAKLRSLRELLFEKLLTTVDEERKRQEYLAGLIARESESNDEISKLESEVADLEADRDAEVSKREKTIQRVLEDLQLITQQGNFVADRVQKGATARITKDEEAGAAKLKQLKVEIHGWKPGKDDSKEDKEIKGMEMILHERRSANHNEEKELRKRKQKTELGIDRIIEEFDGSMLEKQTEIDEIMRLYTDEKIQLTELEERLAVIKVEYDIIMEERKRERDRREKAAEELAKMVKAALLMQKFWRAYKARKALKKATSKKGKGKKKK